MAAINGLKNISRSRDKKVSLRLTYTCRFPNKCYVLLNKCFICRMVLLHRRIRILRFHTASSACRGTGGSPAEGTLYSFSCICCELVSGQIDSSYPPGFVVKLIEVLFANIDKLVSGGSPEKLLETAFQVIDVIQYGISRKQPSTDDRRISTDNRKADNGKVERKG